MDTHTHTHYLKALSLTNDVRIALCGARIPDDLAQICWFGGEVTCRDCLGVTRGVDGERLLDLDRSPGWGGVVLGLILAVAGLLDGGTWTLPGGVLLGVVSVAQLAQVPTIRCKE